MLINNTDIIKKKKVFSSLFIIFAKRIFQHMCLAANLHFPVQSAPFFLTVTTKLPLSIRNYNIWE